MLCLPQVPPVVRACAFAEGHRALESYQYCVRVSTLNTVNSDSLEPRPGTACIASGISALDIVM